MTFRTPLENKKKTDIKKNSNVFSTIYKIFFWYKNFTFYVYKNVFLGYLYLDFKILRFFFKTYKGYFLYQTFGFFGWFYDGSLKIIFFLLWVYITFTLVSFLFFFKVNSVEKFISNSFGEIFLRHHWELNNPLKVYFYKVFLPIILVFSIEMGSFFFDYMIYETRVETLHQVWEEITPKVDFKQDLDYSYRSHKLVYDVNFNSGNAKGLFYKLACKLKNWLDPFLP